MASQIDFASLFDIAPNAYMVVDRDLRYVAANAAYLEVTASRLDQLLGRHVFEAFPNDPDDPNNVPAQMLRKSFERVLSTGKRDHLAFIPYRVPMTVNGKIVVVDRYWSATHCPVLDAAGNVALILQHTVDVTDLYAREASADKTGTDVRNEVGVMSRARAVQEENARIEQEREGLRVLFEQAPGFMCVLEGPDHVFRLANESYIRLVGKRDVLGKPLREALPEVVAQGFIEILDRVYSSGEPFIGDGIRLMLEKTEGTPEEVFVDFVYQPVRGPDGKTRSIFVQGHDVTLTKRAEREREDARRTAVAFSEELQEQSREVMSALDRATKRIAALEAELAAR